MKASIWWKDVKKHHFMKHCLLGCVLPSGWFLPPSQTISFAHQTSVRQWDSSLTSGRLLLRRGEGSWLWPLDMRKGDERAMISYRGYSQSWKVGKVSDDLSLSIFVCRSTIWSFLLQSWTGLQSMKVRWYRSCPAILVKRCLNDPRPKAVVRNNWFFAMYHVSYCWIGLLSLISLT